MRKTSLNTTMNIQSKDLFNKHVQNEYTFWNTTAENLQKTLKKHISLHL